MPQRKAPTPAQVRAILAQLDEKKAPPLPVDALRAIVAHPEPFEEPLREVLAKAVADPTPYLGDEGSFLLLAAVVFVGWRKDTKAFPALCDLLRLPAKQVYGLLADLLTGNFSWVLYNTCGGDGGALRGLVQDEAVAEDARVAAAEALGFLVPDDGFARRELISFLVGLLQEAAAAPKAEREERQYFCTELARALGDMRPVERVEELRAVFASGVIGHPDEEWHFVDYPLSMSAETWHESRRADFEEQTALDPVAVGEWLSEALAFEQAIGDEGDWPLDDDFLDDEDPDWDDDLYGERQPAPPLPRPVSPTGGLRLVPADAEQRRTARNKRKAQGKKGKKKGGKGKKKKGR